MTTDNTATVMLIQRSLASAAAHLHGGTTHVDIAVETNNAKALIDASSR